MKPTEQQLRVLQDYLHKTLNYRETYEEIYDHILSAVEYQPNDISFEDAINNVIRNDFGSPENLLKVEKANKSALVKDMYKKYRLYFTSYFKFPNVCYLLTALFATYYSFAHASISTTIFIIMSLLMTLTPYIIYLLRLYNTGYILGTTKKSAKDKSFETLASIPVRFFVIVNALAVWTGNGFYKVFFSTGNYFLAVYFLVVILFNLSLYKLYKSEFKITTA
jgi:hypothetical protein